MKFLTSKLTVVIVLLGMLGLNLLFVQHRVWWGDFWHHAALVHTLQGDLFPDRDPFIPELKPLIPYWPYAALVAVFSNVFHLTAVDGLAVFSFFNLTFLIFSLERFGRSYSSSALFFPILFVLMLGLWGNSPPLFSSFYHAKVFFFILSYPATFAFALALLGIARITEKSTLESPACFPGFGDLAISTLVALIHPITFLFYCCLAISVLLCRGKLASRCGWYQLIFLLGTPFVVWYFWKPFPLLEVVGSNTFSGDPAATLFYFGKENTIGIAWAALLLLIFRLSPPRRAIIECTLILLSGLFVYGYLTSQWNYGRVVAFIMFMVQVGIAREIFDASKGTSRFAVVFRGAACIFFLIALLRITKDFTNLFSSIKGQNAHAQLSERVLALEGRLPKNEIILADGDISKVLPAIGKQVLVFDIEPFFPHEFNTRRTQQKDFYTPSVPMSSRFLTIRDYAIGIILIDQTVAEEQLVSERLLETGKFLSSDIGFGFTQLTVKPDPYLTQFQIRNNRS